MIGQNLVFGEESDDWQVSFVGISTTVPGANFAAVIGGSIGGSVFCLLIILAVVVLIFTVFYTQLVRKTSSSNKSDDVVKLVIT